MRTKKGDVRPGIEIWKDIELPLVEGLVATDGVVYSTTATFGTTAVVVFNRLLDPGFNMALKKLEVAFTQRFTSLSAALAGSMQYYWEAAHEYVSAEGSMITGAYANITGTYAKNVPTNSNSEDTFSGYVDVANVGFAPARVRLTAVGFAAATVRGEVKNSSFIRFVGNIIPGA